MARSLFLLLLVYLLTFLFPVTPYTPLTDPSLLSISSPGDSFDIKIGSLLAPILQPRVSGTEGSLTVLNHFASFFRTQLPQWSIQFQNSTSRTPRSHGQEIPFVNMIATRDPPGTTPGDVGRLTLVAHYDSKLTPIGFIGATDSAVPCAMLMHAARTIDAALTAKWSSPDASDDPFAEHKGIQIIFMDGEEAFITWTDTDSLYGARSLAEEWESTPHAALSTYKTPLSAISLFVLLDLLGAKSPSVPSYYKTTHWAYQHMADLETRLRSLGQFESSPNHPSKRSKTAATKNPANAKTKAPPKKRTEPLFLPDSAHPPNSPYLGGLIGDDHVPFNARGVETLHIIPSPFPRVWHEMDDDGEHLDLPTVRDWARLVAAFAAEWMDLEGFFPPVEGSSEGGKEGGKEKRAQVKDEL